MPSISRFLGGHFMVIEPNRLLQFYHPRCCTFQPTSAASLYRRPSIGDLTSLESRLVGLRPRDEFAIFQHRQVE